MALTLLAASIYACMGSVTAAVVYFHKREDMKNRDKEIAEEREKEEKTERATRRKKGTNLKHFLHGCKLKLKQVDCATDPLCGACGTRVSGWAYTCGGKCKFFLHEVCAEHVVTLSPYRDSVSKQPLFAGATFIKTSAHEDHPVKEIFSNEGYKCKHCFTRGWGKRFHCSTCEVDLHPVCATHPTKISSYMHPEHELEIKTKPYFKDCAICGCGMGPNIRLYRCKMCKIYVHPTCSQYPQYLLHDLHPPHPLQLKPATCKRSCNAMCGRKCRKGSWCYQCKECSVSIHVACLLKGSNHGGLKRAQIDMRESIHVVTVMYHVVQTATGLVAMINAV